MQKIFVTYNSEIIDYFDDISTLFFIGYINKDHSKVENAYIGRHAELKFFSFDTREEIQNPIQNSKENFELVNEAGLVIFNSNDLIKDDFDFVQYWIPILDSIGFKFSKGVTMLDEYIKYYN